MVKIMLRYLRLIQINQTSLVGYKLSELCVYVYICIDNMIIQVGIAGIRVFIYAGMCICIYSHMCISNRIIQTIVGGIELDLGRRSGSDENFFIIFKYPFFMANKFPTLAQVYMYTRQFRSYYSPIK